MLMSTDVIQINILPLSTLSPKTAARLWSTASESRRQRAERCARQEDALRTLASEALLRHALRQCGLDDALTPLIAERGKPYVQAAHFHYNISHGGDYVVIAYGEREVGVDVEPIKTRSQAWAVARKHFTPDEQQRLFAHSIGSAEFDAAFTLLWTRKESYVKYTGQGLACSLPTFSVDVALPQGRVLDASGNPVEVVTESLFPDKTHIVSVCGVFDALCSKIVTEEELFISTTDTL